MLARLESIIERFASSELLLIIRTSMLWLVPCVLLVNSLLIVGSLTMLMGFVNIDENLFLILYHQLNALIPLLIAGCIGYSRAHHYNLAKLPAGFLCLLYLAILTNMPEPYAQSMKIFAILLAILLPFMALPILARLSQIRGLALLKPGNEAGNVYQSISLILPAILTALILWLPIFILLQQFPENFWTSMFKSISLLDNPYLVGVTFSLTNSILWFFGINGGQALSLMADILNQAVLENALAVQNGQQPGNLLNLAFLSSFVFLGGCGATLSLIVAILLRVKDKRLISIALISIPLALINVNELLLFALPVILNPRLLIPFLLVPMVNVILGLLATQSGLVPVATAPMPFTSPMFINALMVTDGAYSSVFLQLSLIAVGTLIYLPYMKALEHQHEKSMASNLMLQGSMLSSMLEHVHLAAHDPVLERKRHEQEFRLHQQQLTQVSDKEFILRYQPQIDFTTGKFNGFEALIRASTKDGEELPPSDFLPMLTKWGMMHKIDLWVAKEVVRQTDLWAQQGISLPVSINTSIETLENEAMLDEFIKILRTSAVPLCVEIIEDYLCTNVVQVKDSVHKLNEAGISVHIDDFGTGFSSLNYLAHFDTDTLKIDRSFVTSLHHGKSRKVFLGIINFAESLGLNIIIEGIETNQQLGYIPRKRNISIQGYYYGRPMLSEDIPGFLKENS